MNADYGQVVTFTATISVTPPGAGTPTGTVSFKDGASTLGTGAPNASGVATFTISTLSVAMHTITAVYGGDTNFVGSTSGNLTEQIQQSMTTTTVSSSALSAVWGQTVTFTAAITVTAPGGGTPTGTVTFEDGPATLGTASPNASGQATFTISTLSVANHNITAVYSGDTNFKTSMSMPPITEVVAQDSVNVAIASSANPSLYQQVLTFTATVTAAAPGAGTPTGNVTFKEGATILANNVALNGSGQATFTTSSLTQGTHTITGSYAGDPHFLAGSGNDSASPQGIRGNTTTQISSSAFPAVWGQVVTFTARVTANSPATGTPSGTVAFLDGSNTLGTGTLDGTGHATFSTSTLARGSHTISESYGGDTNFFGSGSVGFGETINSDSVTITVASTPNASVLTQVVTFTATVLAAAPGSGTPTGTVNFTEGSTTLASNVTLNGSDQATFTTSSLAVGSNTITASYGGDADFLTGTGDDSASPQVVNTDPTTTAVSSTANPTVFGQVVTFTATVTSTYSGTPTGTATFTEGATTLASSVALNGSAKATFTTSSLAAGTNTVTATYNGDSTFATSTGSDSASPQVVNQASSNTTVSSSSNPSVYGQLVTFTATVSAVSPGSGTPTGTVNFLEGSTTLASGVNLNGSGQATVGISSLSVATHTITAVYSGSTNFNASNGTDSGAPQVVNQGSTTTQISSSAFPAVWGQVVTFTARVTANSPATGTPSGTVAFLDSSTTLGTGALDGTGHATFTTSTLAIGSHTISESYFGDTNFSGSNSTGFGETIGKDSVTITVASTPNPSVLTQVATFTATVLAASPGSGTPTGTVNFTEGSTTLASNVTLNGSDQATFTTSSLAVGSNTIAASYGGDTHFSTGTGDDSAAPQVVNTDPTTTAVTSTSNPSVFGQVVTFTATVTSTYSGTPTGTATFTEGAATLASSVALNGLAQATFTISSLSVASHTVTASYAGDAIFTSSTGNDSASPQVVNKDSSATTVSSTADPSVFGQVVTFTATVTAASPGAGTPTGTVTFKEGAVTLAATVAMTSGQATFTTSSLSVATHTITASYNGDGNFNTGSGTDSGSPQFVNKASSTTTVSSTANPSVFGQVVTFTATVAAFSPGAGTPTGTVTFTEGAATLAATVAMASGQATFTTSSLSVATHTITASYSSDGNFNTSTGTDSASPQVVNKASSSTTVSSTANPSVFGQVVTFTATVAAVSPGAGTPTGTVTFTEGAATLAATVAMTSTQATFTTSSLSVATHTITASYSGDGNFNTSSGTDSGSPQVVNKDSSTTTVSSTANPSVFGQVVTFTATVAAASPGSGTPTGTVTFKEGAATLAASLAMTSGQATFTTSSLSVTTHTITASYNGDGNFNAGSGTDSGSPQVVNKASSSTTVASTVNPSVFGQVVTFTATVAAVSPGAGTPTGTVTFKEGATTLAATVAMASGQATFTTSSLSVTTHTITATYNGDGNFNTSSGTDSGSLQVVNKDSSTTTVSSTSNPSVFGQVVTFTATVTAASPGAGTPTGTVTFTEGAATLAATVAMTSGQATFTTSSLSVATHTITANYSGDGNFNTSTGTDSASPQVVNKASSSTTVTSTANPSVFGQAVTFTATIAAVSPGAGTPTGTVTFTEGAATLAATVAITSGQATFTTSSLSVATHTITASYSGDGNFNASTGNDSASPEMVGYSSTTTVSSTANPSVFGQPVTFTATVSATSGGAGTPTGTVTFKEGSTTLAATVAMTSGQATFTSSSLSTANHTITAVYNGDSNYLTSSGTDSASPQVVNKDSSTTTVSSTNNPSESGQVVTFTATVTAASPGSGTPTGTVTFEEGSTTLAATVAMASGQATFTTSSLSVATHTITANYSGDGNFLASTGNDSASPQVVNIHSNEPFADHVSAIYNASTQSLSVSFQEAVGSMDTPVYGAVFIEPSAPQTGGGIALTGTLSSGQNTVTGLSGTTGLFVGESVTGTGIPSGTTISAINPPSGITLSQNATASGSTALTFSLVFTGTLTNGSTTVSGLSSSEIADLFVGESVMGTGIPIPTLPNNPTQPTPETITTITAIDSVHDTITLSQKATATGAESLTFITGLALDGSGMEFVGNTINTTTTYTQTYTYSSSYQNSFLLTAPAEVAVVLYDNKGAMSGLHSVIGDGSGFNTDSSYTVNGSSYTVSAQAAPTVEYGSSTTVSSAVNPSVFGQVVTFTATVSAVAPGSGTPTGTVTFTEGSATLAATVAMTSGQATFTTSSLSVATHTITAVYSGDGTFVTSTGSDSVSPQVVNKAASTTALVSSPDPSVFGQTVTFTATVSAVAPGAGTPTGTVTFTEGTTTLASNVALNGSAQATFTTASLVAGSNTITASYSGDSNFLTSSATDSGSPQNVNDLTFVGAGGVGLGTAGSYAILGINGGTLAISSAHVLGDIGIGPGESANTLQLTNVTGTFYVNPGDSYNPSGDFTVSGGFVSKNLTQPQSDADTASADYAALTPTQTFGNVSSSLTITGNGGTNVINFTSLNYNPATLTLQGTSSDIFVINVAGSSLFSASSVVLSGGVTFNHVIYNFPNSGTTVTIQGSVLEGGTFLVPYGTIAYSTGGSFYGAFIAKNFSIQGGPSLEFSHTQVVATTAVSSSPNASVLGQTVTLTATVTNTFGGGSTPTGTVTFQDGATTLGSASLNASGQATFTVSSLAVGSHTITASYSGDTNYASGTGNDSTSPQVVNKASSSTTVSSTVNASVFGQAVTFTASVAAVAPGAGTPTGTVTFTEGASTLAANVALSGSAQATFTFSSLSVASHTITASYSGDGNFLSGSGTDAASPQVVNKASSSTTVSSTVNPSVSGQVVTFTATVSAAAPGSGTPTGTVTFKEGSATLAATVGMTSGQATFTTSSLSVATHTITASYSGDGNFQTSTGTEASPQVVNQDSSTTTVSSAANPSVFGQVVTFTATVAAVAPGSGTPTGTVTFKEGSVTLAATVAMTSGQATFTTSSLSVATHTITASYSGDGNFQTSTGTETSPQVVNQDSSTTAVSSTSNPSVFGQVVTFTATVSAASPGAGTPTGTVTFEEGTATLAATVALASGQATFTTSSLSVATHTVTAVYSGDTSFLTSTGTDSTSPQVVNKASSSTTFSSTNPSVFGQVVTFTATVSAVAPGAGTPTGTVTFTDGSATLAATVAMTSGQATFTTSSLSVASHTITASYSGDSNFQSSTFTEASPQVVNQDSSTTAVSSTANPSVFGQPVTFTATVSAASPGAGTPTGTVTFKEGGTTLAATVAMTSGQATFTTSSLSVATHTITAVYSGDGDFLTSTGADSASLQVVNKDSSTTTVSSASNPSVFGQVVTSTATVAAVAPGFGTPTGTVTFEEGAVTLATTVAMTSGQATFTTSSLSVGTHTITASYSGDGNLNASTGDDSASPQVVNQDSSTTTVSSTSNASVFGQVVTFTATVSATAPGSGTPTGTVTFEEGAATLAATVALASGQATFTTSSLSVATHTVTAVYSGDTNFLTSTGTDSTSPQVVNKDSSSTTVSSTANPLVFGQVVTFTATVSAVVPGAGTPTGTVTFTEGSATLAATVAMTSGQATFTTSLLSVATHTITASYSGDGNFQTSTGTEASPQVVNQDPSTTAVSSTANPSVFGQPITFTATVSAASPGAGIPTGTVTFKEGSTTLAATVAMTSGQATFTTSSLSIATHTITAVYNGDGNFLTSTGTDSASPQVVNKDSSTTTVSSTVNPSVFGQLATFTATVAAVAPGSGTPTGTVTFEEGAVTLAATVAIVSGQATFTTSSLSVATHTITASYSGDGNFLASTGDDSASPQVVNIASSTTTITSSTQPSVFGQTVTFTATVSAVAPAAGTPTGTAIFTEGSTTLASGVTLSSGQATFTISSLGLGSHTITASYSGDGNFLPSSGDDSASPQVVNQDTSTVSVSSTANPSVFGQKVTFTATITAAAPGSGTPTGTVSFQEGISVLAASLALTSGQATFTTSTLAVGSHTVTVFYSSDTDFVGGLGTDAASPQVVNKGNTSAVVDSSAFPAVYGQAITFTILVRRTSPAAGTLTGTVTLLDGTTTLGTSTIDSTAHATFLVSTLAVGNHVISATYSGDGNFNASRSIGFGEQIMHAPTTVTVVSSPSTSVFGQQTTFTATVSSGAPGGPTGTITFYEGSTAISSNLVVNASGQAELVTSALGVGTHTISASYGGDNTFLPSTGDDSASPQQVIQGDTSTVILTSSLNSPYGQVLTLTASVRAIHQSNGIATGTVTFFDGATSLGTGTLDGSAFATFTTNTLAVGNHAIYGSYGGDGNFNPSTSAGYGETINEVPTSVSVSSSPGESVYGQLVTFTATVTTTIGLIPNGTVSFMEGSTVLVSNAGIDASGEAKFITSALTVGTHTITASYSGTGFFFPSTGDDSIAPQVVDFGNTTTVVSSSAPPLYLRSSPHSYCKRSARVARSRDRDGNGDVLRWRHAARHRHPRWHGARHVQHRRSGRGQPRDYRVVWRRW